MEARVAQQDHLLAVDAQLISEKDLLITALRTEEEQLRDRITRMETMANKLSRITFFAKQLTSFYKPFHHLGSYEPVDKSKKRWEVEGTLAGFFGLHPIDASPDLPAEFLSFTRGSEYGVVTWDWRKAVDLGHPMYYAITKPPGFGYSFSYPDASLNGFVARAFDPNPPEPSWHTAGLMAVVERWRTEIWDSDYVVWNRNLENTLNRWCDRVMPFVMRLEQLVNMIVASELADSE